MSDVLMEFLGRLTDGGNSVYQCDRGHYSIYTSVFLQEAGYPKNNDCGVCGQIRDAVRDHMTIFTSLVCLFCAGKNNDYYVKPIEVDGRWAHVPILGRENHPILEPQTCRAAAVYDYDQKTDWIKK